MNRLIPARSEKLARFYDPTKVLVHPLLEDFWVHQSSFSQRTTGLLDCLHRTLPRAITVLQF